MSLVNICSIELLDNPAKFSTPLSFNITFEVIAPIKEDIEFKITYVGSADNQAHDQTLESIMVGPVPVGVNQFVLSADPPNPSLIPHDDFLGVTLILLTCTYKDREFIRIGYYLNNEYETAEMNEAPPAVHDYSKVIRNILADKPRVTKFRIPWDSDEVVAPETVIEGEPQGEPVIMNMSPEKQSIVSGTEGEAMNEE